MNREDLYYSISDISPEFIEELNESTEKKKHSDKAIIITICAVVALAGVTVFAASKINFGRGMSDLQIDESQQQSLVETSAAIIYETQEDYSDLAVTSEGVTITPVSVIADERCAYISFKISGFSYDDRNNEPIFDWVYVYADENQTEELDSTGSFDDGLVSDGADGFVYYDGTPTETNEYGGAIPRYFDDNNDLYYLMCVSSHNIDDNMLGRTLYIKFTCLAESWKTQIITCVDSEWNLKLELPSQSTSVHMEVQQEIEGSPYYLESIDISPVSIRLNYTTTNSGSGIPFFVGVVFDDGRKLGINNDSLNGWDGNKAYTNVYFAQVIDPDKVSALLIYPTFDSGTYVTIPIK